MSLFVVTPRWQGHGQVRLYAYHITEICPRYDTLLSVFLKLTVYPELCEKHSGGTNVQLNFSSN